MIERVARPFRGARRARYELGSRFRVLILRLQFPGIEIRGSTRVDHGCEIYVGRGSKMVLENCKVGRGVSLITAPGASLYVAADLVGPHSVVVARKHVVIGRGSKLAENVTVRDANHDHRVPLSDGRFITGPVTVGEDVWLAAKVTVLAGVTIGSGATVGAGAVVTKDIPSGATAVGVPARLVVH